MRHAVGGQWVESDGDSGVASRRRPGPVALGAVVSALLFLAHARAPFATTAAILAVALVTRPRASRPVADDAREIDIDAVCSRSRAVQLVTSFFIVSVLCRPRLVVAAAGLELSWRFGKRVIPWPAIRHAEAEASCVRLELEDKSAVELPTRVSGTYAALAANYTIADIIAESRRCARSPYRVAGARSVIR